jgi:DNA (cytosine-5)-methyltransferase 1
VSLTVGSLFAGIGGFDLAARWMGWRTVWHSEIDPYACAVFAQHFPESRNVGDVTTWQPDPAGDAVDVICGGFPCQPVSVAGKRKAQDDDRWLWPEFARVLGVLRPRFAVVENVPGLLVRGMGDVLGDLAALGYDAEWESIPAGAVGAEHIRDRIWMVAHLVPTRPPLRRKARANGPDARRFGTRAGLAIRATPTGLECRGTARWRGDVHGIPRRVDRIACLGNAIVPQVAYAWAFQRVAQLAGA